MLQVFSRPLDVKAWAWIMIGVSLCVGFLTRIAALWRYVDFESDQAHEAYAVMGMWHGAWPTLGPYVSIPFSSAFYHLPPLYYYIVFPFTLLGAHPTIQALPNAMFSFLTIPLLTFTLHRLLCGVESSKRLFLSALGGLWWSFMLTEIVRGTKEWNPSAIPFFTLLFVLIAADQLKRLRADARALLAWAVLGILLALFASLHATTLYVMPIVFLIVSGAFVARSQTRCKALGCVLLSLLIMGACLTPYWQGEMKNAWSNSRIIVALTEEKAVSASSMEEKIKNALRAYRWLNGQCYFLGDDARVRQLGAFFLFVILISSATLDFRGDRVLLGVAACVWIVFLFAASEFSAVEERFRLPIIMAPVFLTISSLAFLNHASWHGRVLSEFLFFSIIVSIGSNVIMDVRHASYLIGPSRLVGVSDTIDAFEHIPYGASVCDARRSDDYVADRYIDTYITRRNLSFSKECMPGTYQIVPHHFGWNGSDFYLNHEDYEESYILFSPPLESLKIPADAKVIERTGALDVLLRGENDRGA